MTKDHSHVTRNWVTLNLPRRGISERRASDRSDFNQIVLHLT